MVAMNVWPTDAADGAVTSEARWRKMGRLWTPTGVAGAVSTGLLPTLAFPNLTVKAGACWVDGHYCELLGDQVLAVTANGLAVVRFDPAANTAQLLYLDGATVPGQSPTGVYELAIAKISGSALVDLRPIVTASSLTFPSIAARDAYPAVNGDVAVVAGTIYTRAAGVWSAVGGPGAPSFRLIGGGIGQGVAPNTQATCTWTSESSDALNLVAGGIFACPPEWAGRWQFEYSVRFPGPSTGIRNAYVSGFPARYAQQTLPQTATGDTNLTGSASIVLGANATISVVIFHNHSGGLNCNNGTDDYFQGRYVSPN